jgi:hypothetical protein
MLIPIALQAAFGKACGSEDIRTLFGGRGVSLTPGNLRLGAGDHTGSSNSLA